VNRLLVFIAALLLTPCYMPPLTAHAEGTSATAKKTTFDTAFVSIKTNDQIISDSLKKELLGYMESRLHEIGVKSSPVMDTISGARLVCSLHIGYENDLNKYLGYEHENQRKYLVFMELSLERSVTVNGEKPVTKIAVTWTSGMNRRIDKTGHRPFVSTMVELKNKISDELINLMDEFIAFHQSTHDQ